MTAILTPEDIQRDRVEGVVRVFERMNSTLVGRKIKTELVAINGAGAPAWTDGSTVTFNSADINYDGSVDDMVLMFGLDYHEIGHLLWSPAPDSHIVKSCRSSGWSVMLNVLEDMRQERLTIAKWPSVKPYLVSTTITQILAPHLPVQDRWVFIAGRRYLPSDVGVAIKAAFARPDLADEFERIAVAFTHLDFSRHADQVRGVALVAEAVALWGELSGSTDDPPHTCISSTDSRCGGFPVPKDQRAADEPYDPNAAGGDDDDEDIDGDDSGDGPEEGDGDADGQATDGDGGSADSDSDGKGGEGEGDGAEGGDGGEGADGDGTDASSDTASHGGGAGGGSVSNPTIEDLADMLRDIQDAIHGDADVLDEVRRAQAQAAAGGGGAHLRNVGRGRTPVNVNMDVRNSSRLLQKEFERLESDVEAGWHTMESEGRLNVFRWTTGDDLEVCYDRWDEGAADAVDIEAILIVDASGSMGWGGSATSPAAQVTAATWAIGRALQSIGADVMVMTYDDSSYILYDEGERFDPYYARPTGSGGSTDPRGALREAALRMHHSKRSVKYVFVLTDGHWNGGAETEGREIIERMTRAGVVTAMIGYEYGIGTAERWGASMAVDIKSGDDLVTFAREAVTHTTRRLALEAHRR